MSVVRRQIATLQAAAVDEWQCERRLFVSLMVVEPPRGGHAAVRPMEGAVSILPSQYERVL